MVIEKDPYIEEALKELERISNDPARRQEYQDREDALRDYRSLKESARRTGVAEGKAEIIEVIIKKIDKKKTVEEIADMLEQDTIPNTLHWRWPKNLWQINREKNCRR